MFKRAGENEELSCQGMPYATAFLLTLSALICKSLANCLALPVHFNSSLDSRKSSLYNVNKFTVNLFIVKSGFESDKRSKDIKGKCDTGRAAFHR